MIDEKMQDWKKLEPNWFVVTFCISKKLNSHLYKFTKWKVMRTQDVHYRSNRFVRWNTKLYIKNLTCLKATYAKYITHPTENEEWHMIPYRHDLRLWFGGTTISIFGISNFRINIIGQYAWFEAWFPDWLQMKEDILRKLLY